MIILPLPPSINQYYGHNNYINRRYKKPEAKAWEMEAGLKLKQQFKEKFGKEKVALTVYYYFGNSRSDLGNRTKILQDLFEKVAIIDNDNQVWERHEYKNIDHSNPRVEVKIERLQTSN